MPQKIIWNEGNIGALALECIKIRIRMHGEPFKLDSDLIRKHIWALAEEHGISYETLSQEVLKVLRDLAKESEKAIEGIQTPPESQ